MTVHTFAIGYQWASEFDKLCPRLSVSFSHTIIFNVQNIWRYRCLNKHCLSRTVWLLQRQQQLFIIYESHASDSVCNRVFFLLKKYHLHVDCLQHHPMGDQMELIMYLENNVFAMCVYACRKQQEHSNMFTGKVKHIKHCCNDEYIFSVMM